jgi:uncharacterized membrane protein
MREKLLSILRSRATIALLLMSLFSIALLLARVLFTARANYVFMLWNLFLAFVPWALATAIRATGISSRLLFLLIVLLWLAFFPNAPYVLTDLTHLGYDRAAPRWYDLLMLLSFGFTGAYYGFTSLKAIEDSLFERFGVKRPWIASAILIYVSCLGIYLGRFLRWNSWDLVTNLDDVMSDVYQRVANPLEYASAWIYIFLFGTLLNLLFFSYKAFASRDPDPGDREKQASPPRGKATP